MIFLDDRSILEISGPENKRFLQGMITNDLSKASAKNLIYAAMLNAQGRFLCDFFIFERDGKLFLDCPAKRRDEILQKLIFYKLRAQIEIKKNDEIKVIWNQEDHSFPDPRTSKMGYRLYTNSQITTTRDLQNYHLHRIQNKIPESEYDLTYEKSFILEFGFDDLNAISYDKGCYIGQEITARTHHKGEIRKKIFYIKTDAKKAEKNSAITTSDGSPAGAILSSVFYGNELHALALIKLEYCEKELEFEDKKISIIC